jgi:hypothetical protein
MRNLQGQELCPRPLDEKLGLWKLTAQLSVSRMKSANAVYRPASISSATARQWSECVKHLWYWRSPSPFSARRAKFLTLPTIQSSWAFLRRCAFKEFEDGGYTPGPFSG